MEFQKYIDKEVELENLTQERIILNEELFEKLEETDGKVYRSYLNLANSLDETMESDKEPYSGFLLDLGRYMACTLNVLKSKPIKVTENLRLDSDGFKVKESYASNFQKNSRYSISKITPLAVKNLKQLSNGLNNHDLNKVLAYLERASLKWSGENNNRLSNGKEEAYKQGIPFDSPLLDPSQKKHKPKITLHTQYGDLYISIMTKDNSNYISSDGVLKIGTDLDSAIGNEPRAIREYMSIREKALLLCKMKIAEMEKQTDYLSIREEAVSIIKSFNSVYNL